MDALTPPAVISGYPPHARTLHGMLASRIAAAPWREFLAFEDRNWSYAAFGQAVERRAVLLHARGAGAGDRIGVVSTNHPGTVLMLFALARLGAILVAVVRRPGAQVSTRDIAD